MVDVTIHEDSRGRLSSFSAAGHAGWAEADDVVCAAVSALLQAAWLGLAEVAAVDIDGKRSSGSLQLRWKSEVSGREDVSAIVQTVARSIERLALQFPDHVRAVRLRASSP